jgi:hypothetical protein
MNKSINEQIEGTLHFMPEFLVCGLNLNLRLKQIWIWINKTEIKRKKEKGKGGVVEREMCPWAISKYFGDQVPTQMV